MDDLDHSMHIAEFDWTSFFDESEECGLLQPALACPDHTSLSDSEDSGNSSPVFITGQQELQQSPDANKETAEWENDAPSSKDEVQNHVNGSGGKDEETKTGKESETQASCKIGQDDPEGKAAAISEETNDDVTLQTNQISIQSSDSEAAEPTKAAQTQSDTPDLTRESDPLSCNQAALNVKAEKERWFVTVNYSPARRRVPAASGKKKRRQKKPRKESQMCRTSNQEKSSKDGVEFETNRDNNEDKTVISDSSQMSSTSAEEDNSSENPIAQLPPRGIFSISDTFTIKRPLRFDSLESEDGAEFFSTHSYDSESYLSAAESMDEPFMENQHLQESNSSCQLDQSENTEAEDEQVKCESSPCSNAESTISEGYESSQISPSVSQIVNEMPDEVSACDHDDLSMLPCGSSDSPGLTLPASVCSSGDLPGLPSVPDLTVTLCSAAASPETYAEAAGNTRPVYAISAFWDEMEKLTINDILQLRMGGGSTPREMQEAETPNVEDFPSNHSSLEETGGFSLSNRGSMDASDTADSDYFTQADESKPDRSSCEFSTSDFEEEYWQFLGASRNVSPDLQSKNKQQDTGGTSYFEEEESTCSEGKETPVPLEDVLSTDQESEAFVWPRQITKTKSVRNVQALNTEDLSLQVLLGENEDGRFLRSSPSMEEIMTLEETDNLGTLIPASFVSSTVVLDEQSQMSLPEVFGRLLKDQTKRDSCVNLYDPEDLASAPEFDYIRDEKSFSFLHERSDKKPIPIFSCSHPTVRELTFPNPDFVFLSSDYTEENISPIRVVSRAFLLGSDYGTVASALPGIPSLLSVRKICFQNKGSIWCGSSGAWMLPVEALKNPIEGGEPALTAPAERSVSTVQSQMFGELELQQQILETIQATRRVGICSTLRQSDMCLVCIAFASWVLRSSDPEAADTWKAALLANVSALSAIQYLRQYVKKKPS